MQIKKIKTKTAYKRSLERFEALFFADSNTTKGKEARLLAKAIKAYEDKHFKMD